MYVKKVTRVISGTLAGSALLFFVATTAAYADTPIQPTPMHTIATVVQ